jgi:hypothetical protein
MKTENKEIENKMEECCSKKSAGKNFNKSGGSGAFYCLGLIGTAVYFIQHAHSFMDGLVGILKAIIWPALVAYKFFEFFKY